MPLLIAQWRLVLVAINFHPKSLHLLYGDDVLKSLQYHPHSSLHQHFLSLVSRLALHCYVVWEVKRQGEEKGER